MSWDTRWRNSGFLWAYILFNMALVFGAFYLTRVGGFTKFMEFVKGGKPKGAKKNVEQTKGASVQPFVLGATGAGIDGEKNVTSQQS